MLIRLQYALLTSVIAAAVVAAVPAQQPAQPAVQPAAQQPVAQQTLQQLVQRGPFSKPAQVLDDTGQWTTPLPVFSDADVELFIPDITAADWLNRNYPGFLDKGQYTVSMFTLYKTPRACRVNQTQSGFADAAHLDACMVTIRYRLRQALVDTQQKTVTLLTAAMLNQDGGMDPASVQHESRTRSFSELDAGTQAALAKTNELVAKQMRLLDLRIRAVQ